MLSRSLMLASLFLNVLAAGAAPTCARGGNPAMATDVAARWMSTPADGESSDWPTTHVVRAAHEHDHGATTVPAVTSPVCGWHAALPAPAIKVPVIVASAATPVAATRPASVPDGGRPFRPPRLS